MVYDIISKVHNLWSQLLNLCSYCSSHTMVLTIWVGSITILYILFSFLFKTFTYKVLDGENDPLIEICQAIEENDIVACVRLLDVYPQYINKFTREGYTPFLIACANGNTQIVRLMLRKGADVRLKSTNRESAFYLSTFHYIKYPQLKNATCIRELYYAGADINEPNDKGLTPLQMAAMFGHTPLVKWLLLKNASVRTVPDPYLIACSQGHQDTAKLIWKTSMKFSLNYK